MRKLLPAFGLALVTFVASAPVAAQNSQAPRQTTEQNDRSGQLTCRRSQDTGSLVRARRNCPRGKIAPTSETAQQRSGEVQEGSDSPRSED